MDAWVACKHGLVCNTNPNGSTFELTCLRTLLNTPLQIAKKFKKWVKKDVELFIISGHKLINELVNENSLNEMGGKLLEDYFDVFHVKLLGLPPTREIDHAIDLMSNAKPFQSPLLIFFVEYE